jgi:porin
MRWHIVLLLVCWSAGSYCEAADIASAGATAEAALTSVYQYGFYDHATDENGARINDKGRGSFALDVQGEVSPTRNDTLYALASFARGNGLKNEGGVSLVTNADYLEDDVENINGRDRDYLLEAWYRRRLIDRPSLSFAVTGGLIDATRYLDHNRVANDEITQFMNEAFVNRFALPSYDPGIALQTQGKKWHTDMTWMHTQTESDKNGGVDYNFYGIDVGYAATLPFGESHIHLLAQTTSSDFEDRNNPRRRTAISALGLSLDQAIGDGLALFLRTGNSNDNAAYLVHDALYSAGFQIEGYKISVPKLVAGVAYAYLDGAGGQPGDIRDTRVLESYVRYPLADLGDISLDVQWVSDDVRGAENPELWVIGTRLNLYL